MSSPEKNTSIHKYLFKFFLPLLQLAKELPVYFTRLPHEKLRMQLLVIEKNFLLVVRTTFFNFFFVNSSTGSFMLDSADWIFFLNLI